MFGLGCIVGLLSFARLVSWLFNKYHNITVGILSGFMIGSLNKVWPWKEAIETYIDRHGEIKPLIEANVLPNEYFAKTGAEPFFLEAILFAAAGFLIVLAIDRIAALLNPQK
jgi:putative membrane protein